MDSPSAVRTMLKNGAKRRLFRYYLPCAGVSLASGLVTMLVSRILGYRLPSAEEMLKITDFTPYLSQFAEVYGLSFLFTLLLSPLTVGSYSFYMDVAREKRPPFSMIFSWLGEAKKLKTAYAANLLYVLILLKNLVLYTLLPAALFLGSVFLFERAPLMLALLVYVLAGLLLLAGGVFAYAHSNLYQPALFMLAEDPTLGVRQTFGFCGRVMKKRMWEFFRFRISFLLWEIIGSLTYGLSVLFVTPYVDLSISGYTHWLMMQVVDEYLQNPPPADDPDALLLGRLLKARAAREQALSQNQNPDDQNTGSEQ